MAVTIIIIIFSTQSSMKTDKKIFHDLSAEPKTTKSNATEPKTTKSNATEPKPTERKATEPKPTERKATEPKTTKSKPTEPKTTKSNATEPKTTKSNATEPKPSERKATEPKTTKSKPTELKDYICLTSECVRSAASIISSMDFNEDPCEDFYSYSCNNWKTENPIPDGKAVWSTFLKRQQQNQLIIKQILENSSTNFKSSAEKKAKIFYDACIDANGEIERLGTKPLLHFLEEIGGWDQTDMSNWSLQNTLQILHNKYNMGGLFKWRVAVDDKNSGFYRIKIYEEDLILPVLDLYLNETNSRIRDLYLEYMTKIRIILNGEPVSSKNQIITVFWFEMKLAEIRIKNEEFRDGFKSYNLMTLRQLQDEAPFISWVEYFRYIFTKVNIPIDSNTQIVVSNPKYLKELSVLIGEYMKNEKKERILKDYLVWHTVANLIPYLPKEFQDAGKNLRRHLMGSEGGESPGLSCIADTNNALGFAVGSMFAEKVFQKDSKAAVEKLFLNVRDAFLHNLQNLTWVDVSTKYYALMKTHAIQGMIAFPDFILNKEQLDAHYAKLEVKENEYFMNYLRVNQYNLIKNIEILNDTVDKKRWDMMPSTVNAYYSSTMNEIFVPMGILRFPFFDINHFPSLNYGSLGVIMGHEIVHAFDNLGREYDISGNLRNWWNKNSLESFNNKSNCLVEQYSQYEINGQNVNGNLTLGENIADNGGLRAALLAYEKTVGNETEFFLPGLNLTQKQLFFVSFAQTWCYASTDEIALLMLKKELHPPPQFRVIGPLSNSKEFSEAFNCSASSRMNPEKKCNIW